MNFKYINWQQMGNISEWELSLAYHRHSGYHSYSKSLERSRVKMLKKMLEAHKGNITNIKRYFSTPEYELDAEKINLDFDTQAMIRKTDEFIRSLSIERTSCIAGEEEVYLFFQYWLLPAENQDGYALYYYNAIREKLEMVKTVTAEQVRSIFIEPIDFKGRIQLVTYHLRMAVELLGEPAYRLGLIDSGILINQVSSFACIPREDIFTQFFDSHIHSLLNINGDAEIPLAIMIKR